MDVIDRYRWRRVQMCGVWTGLGLLTVISFALLCWWYVEWRSSSTRLAKLESLEKKVEKVDAKVDLLLDRSLVHVFTWKAKASFASGEHLYCDRPDPPDGISVLCKWAWRSEADLPEPRELLNLYLKERRIVLLLIAPGHDGQPLSAASKKQYETNLGLAYARGYVLMKTLLDLGPGQRCEDKDEHLRCVVLPNGATEVVSEARAQDRVPSLTMLVGGERK